jgi:hypothetical protein
MVNSPQEAGYHSITMHRQRPTVSTVLLSLGIMACGSGRPASLPSPTPQPAETINPTPPGERHLTFLPGAYRYRLTQRAEIRAAGVSDTVPPGIVTTEALFHVDVSQENDSAIHATVYVDSIRITSQGSIPPITAPAVTRIDSILHVRFSRILTTFGNPIPDSLCAYASLTGVARLIVLPELALDPEVSARKTYTDTIREASCHAGAHVEVLTTRHLRSLGKNPTELAIEQVAEFQGVGVLRRDSIFMSGTTATGGTISFTEDSRLPSIVVTNSEGTITVQLGPVHTVFKQLTRQEIRQVLP